MSLGQQAGIEKLFNRINKNLRKNPKEKIADTDLNKLRAYIVKSQRPLQVVRLLEKEKEEREVDLGFKQQEEIFEKAQQIEDEKKIFEEKQQR